MIDLIHIGDYKTGTSWLQRFAFQGQPEVIYIDRPQDYPKIAKLFYELVDVRDLDFDAIGLRRRFQEELEKVDYSAKKLVVSREALSGHFISGEHAKRIADRLFLVFGAVKILLVIREQFSMLASIYSQYVKIGGTLCFNEFIFDPIVSSGLIERLKYHKVIGTYIEVFGEDNVFVGLYDEFKSNNKRFVNRVFKFIGCSEGWHLSSREIVVNPSLTALGIGVQRFINRFLRNDFNPGKPFIPLDVIASIFLSAENKKRLLDGTRNRLIYSERTYDDKYVLKYAINFTLTTYVAGLCERIQFGPQLIVTESLRETLGNEFIESNHMLHEKYELPVDSYGWSW